MEHKEANETVGTASRLLEIGRAMEILKKGGMVQRLGWGAKGTFIFMQVPSKVDMAIVPKMTSLPESVKVILEKRFKGHVGYARKDVDPINLNDIRYQDQIARVYPDNRIVAWCPSVSDVLANDWIEIK